MHTVLRRLSGWNKIHIGEVGGGGGGGEIRAAENMDCKNLMSSRKAVNVNLTRGILICFL